MRANAATSVGHVLARLDACPANATYGGAMPCAREPRRGRPRRRAVAGRKRSWSTPCGATTTGARAVEQPREPVGGVLAHAITSAPRARGAARIIGGRTRPSLRSCHSGWSKNVRSCTVTTAGTRQPQRHRVVRPVPHVDAERGRRAAGAAVCSHASRAGRRSGTSAWTVGLGREVRPARRVVAAGEEVEVELVVLGEPARPAAPCRRRRRPDGRAPPRRRAAGARRASLRASPRTSPRRRQASPVGARRRRPR